MRDEPHEQRLPPLPDGTVQIHARRADDGHWSAAFDWFPEVSFGGDTALVAAKRLVRSADGLEETTLRLAYRSEDGRTAGFTVLPVGEGCVCPSAAGRGGTSGWSWWKRAARVVAADSPSLRPQFVACAAERGSAPSWPAVPVRCGLG